MPRYVIGTCGFSYADWRGFFYPVDMRRSDFLVYYSRHFTSTELNSTYYLLPSLKTIEAMMRKTGSNFVFSVKANQVFTHSRSYTRTDLEKMREILFAFDGKLGVVLFQFPHSFHKNRENIKYVEKVREDFQEFDIAFEFRSNEWFSEGTYRLLEELGCGIVCVDEPAVKGLPPPVFVSTTRKFAYIRFHGRNAQKWYDHVRPEERYDYLYSRGELLEWVEKIRETSVDTLFIYFNNHPRAQAVENAKMMSELLCGL